MAKHLFVIMRRWLLVSPESQLAQFFVPPMLPSLLSPLSHKPAPPQLQPVALPLLWPEQLLVSPSRSSRRGMRCSISAARSHYSPLALPSSRLVAPHAPFVRPASNFLRLTGQVT